MVSVNIVINVAGEPPGVPGQSRTFPFSKIETLSPLVTLSIENTGGVFSYLWEILKQPVGASAIFDDPTSATPSFSPTVAIDGTYIFKCTVNGGEAYQLKGLAFTSPLSALRKIAPGETTEFDDDRGYSLAYDDLINKLDGGGGGGGGIFAEGSGALSSQRISAGMDTAGDYAFNTGYGNTIDLDSDYSTVFGSGVYLAGSPRSQVFGHDCFIFDTTSYFAKPGPGGNHIVSPYSNGIVEYAGSNLNVETSPLLFVGAPISDGLPQIGKAVIDGDTYWYSAWTNAGSNAPNGEFTLSNPVALTRTYTDLNPVLAGSLNISNSYIHGAYNLLNNVGGGLVFGAYNILARLGGTETLLGAAVFGGGCVVSGHINFVGGMFSTVSGYGNFTYGQDNNISGDYNGILGIGNIIPGNWQLVFGEDNNLSGESGFTFGRDNISASNYVGIFGEINQVGAGSEGSVILGYNNIIGFIWSGTGLAKTTTYVRGGTNITDLGNSLGNDHLKVKNTVLGGYEGIGPAPVMIVDINMYPYATVTDTPSPRFMLDGVTLAENSSADLDVKWGCIAGTTEIFPLDYAPFGTMPPVGIARIGGSDSYLFNNIIEPVSGYWILTGLDRPLDADYIDTDTLELGNLAGSPIFWCNEDTTVMPPTGYVSIDGDLYEYGGVGQAWPGLWGIGLGGSTPVLTRDYDDNCVVEYVSSGFNVHNLIKGYGNMIFGGGNSALCITSAISGNYNAAIGYGHNISGNVNSVFGGDITLNSTERNGVFGYNHVINYGSANLVGGGLHTIENTQSSFISGYSNDLNQAQYCSVMGQNNTIFGYSQGVLISGSGNNHSTGFNNIIAGSYNAAYSGMCNAIFGYANSCGPIGAPHSPTNNLICGTSINFASNPTYTSYNSACFGGYYAIPIARYSIISGYNFTFPSVGFEYSACFGEYHNIQGGVIDSIFAGKQHTADSGGVYGVAAFGTNNFIYGGYNLVGGLGNTVYSYAAVFGTNNLGDIYSLSGGNYNTIGNYGLAGGNSNVGSTGTIIGGWDNGTSVYSVVGGHTNSIRAYSAIFGASNSAANSDYSLIAGQSHSCAVATHAVIGGGNNILLASNYCAMFGYNNQIAASSPYSILSGILNYISGNNPGNAVFGSSNNVYGGGNGMNLVAGYANEAYGYGIVGGSNNRASVYSLVCGRYSYVRWPFSIAHSSAAATNARLNTVDVPLNCYTNTDSWTNLFIALGWEDSSLSIPDHTVILFDIDIVATRADIRGETKSWKLQFTAANEGNVITIDTPVKNIISNASSVPWDIQVVSYGPSGGNYGVKIQVKGETSKTISWQASVRATEINTTN